MRVISIIALAIFLPVSCARAVSPVEFGVRGGVGLRNADMGNARAGRYALSADARTGYFAGMSMQVNMGRYHIRPEINYVRNSYTLTAAEPASSSTSTVRISSLEVPVLAGVRVLRFFHLQAGPVFNLMSDTSVSAPRSNTTGVEAPEHAVLYTAPSVGYAVGVSARIAKVADVAARYGGYFRRPVQNTSIGGQSAETPIRMNGWTISLGIHF